MKIERVVLGHLLSMGRTSIKTKVIDLRESKASSFNFFNCFLCSEILHMSLEFISFCVCFSFFPIMLLINLFGKNFPDVLLTNFICTTCAVLAFNLRKADT